MNVKLLNKMKTFRSSYDVWCFMLVYFKKQHVKQSGTCNYSLSKNIWLQVPSNTGSRIVRCMHNVRWCTLYIYDKNQLHFIHFSVKQAILVILLTLSKHLLPPFMWNRIYLMPKVKLVFPCFECLDTGQSEHEMNNARVKLLKFESLINLSLYHSMFNVRRLILSLIWSINYIHTLF